MGTIVKCRLCNSEVEGDGKGNMIYCECGKLAIDETKYYCRINGNPGDYLVLNGDDSPRKEMEQSKSILKDSRVSKTQYYLNIAEQISERSTCLKRHYGAVIVNNDEIISTGYNGAPRGISSCLEHGECRRNNAERGKDYSNCCSVHAEQNAIISASRRDLLGSTLYLVGFECDYFKHSSKPLAYVNDPAPCSICKRMIINAGINKVVVRLNKDNFIVFYTKDWKVDDIVGGY